MAETRENRIRERAYHLREAGGRPSGRDEEFWHRACGMIASDEDQPESRVKPAPAKAGANGTAAAQT